MARRSSRAGTSAVRWTTRPRRTYVRFATSVTSMASAIFAAFCPRVTHPLRVTLARHTWVSTLQRLCDVLQYVPGVTEVRLGGRHLAHRQPQDVASPQGGVRQERLAARV